MWALARNLASTRWGDTQKWSHCKNGKSTAKFWPEKVFT